MSALFTGGRTETGQRRGEFKLKTTVSEGRLAVGCWAQRDGESARLFGGAREVCWQPVSPVLYAPIYRTGGSLYLVKKESAAAASAACALFYSYFSRPIQAVLLVMVVVVVDMVGFDSFFHGPESTGQHWVMGDRKIKYGFLNFFLVFLRDEMFFSLSAIPGRSVRIGEWDESELWWSRDPSRDQSYIPACKEYRRTVKRWHEQARLLPLRYQTLVNIIGV